MSRPEYLEPLKRTYRNRLRKKKRILPSEVASPFFYAKDINTVEAYFSAIKDGQAGSLTDLSTGFSGNCYVCKRKVEFAVDGPDQVSQINWRETCTCPECGLINRWRSCLHVFEEICEPGTDDRIYLTESLSPVCQSLAARFPLLSASEYLPDAEFGELSTRYDDIVRNEDVTNLAFADASMDIVLCFDVLEHVSNYREALKEFYRVLGSGGQLVLSVPFSHRHETLVRATLDEDGSVNHLVEPCYHGDPLSEQGVLSYYDFGMDLLEEMHSAGFQECFVLCFCAKEWGYPDENVVFIARKLKSSLSKTTIIGSAWKRTVNQTGFIAERLIDFFRYNKQLVQKRLDISSERYALEFIEGIPPTDFTTQENIAKTELPDIFHYWSNKYIAPDLNRFGCSNPGDLFFQQTRDYLKKSAHQRINILSIGSGDCAFEIKIIERLLRWRLSNFVLECVEVNQDKLDSGRRAVIDAGLSDYFLFTCEDSNHWQPYRRYGVVFANQSLHEVYRLEGLFDSVKRALKPGGLFIISDKIGRNANMCWPEAIDAIKPFWQELPQSYRYNRLLKRQEEHFINPDGLIRMSGAIRSQDILILLIERFNFKFFFPYGNIIFVFIDKAFGHNFDVNADWDKGFVDRVHSYDEAALISGELAPVSMMAVLTREETEMVLRHPVLTPQHCVRKDPVCGGVGPVEAELKNLVNNAVVDQRTELNRRFLSAGPFHHVAVDNFLDEEFARSLLENFPVFNEKLAINEDSEVGGKAVQEKVSSLGPTWRQLDKLVAGSEFRHLISGITGIDYLKFDPQYFGGGTHENLHGQSLNPHVDFNYHPLTRQHRRLNLILYLSPEWDENWGGSIQLHKDPYLPPTEDEIVTITPAFNRCVIFETNEHSWHGFKRIDLPEDKRGLSRKSFALYYYTDKRPAEELGEEHSTIYVEEHLPGHFVEGMELGTDDLQHVKNLLTSRDKHLKRLYKDIQRLNTELSYLRGEFGVDEDLECIEPGENDSVELIVLKKRYAVLQRRIRDYEHSTSWRITRPIRVLKRILTGKG